MAASTSDMEIARKTWEIENEIETVPSSDEIFRYDGQEQQALLAARKFVIVCTKIIFEWQFLTFD